MGNGGSIQRTVAAAASALTFLFGAAQWVFYDRLGVRPDELGLGTDDVLVQAAVGAVALLVSAAVVWAVGVLWNLGVLATVDNLRSSRVAWTDVFVLVIGVLYAVDVWLHEIPDRVLVAGPIVWLALFAWTRRRRARPDRPTPWEAAAGLALLWLAAIPVGILVAIFVRGHFDGHDASAIMWVTAGLDTVLALVVGIAGSRIVLLGRIDANALGSGGVLVATVLVGLLTAVAAVTDADAVRKGQALTTPVHRLVGGPVTCVEPKPSPVTTNYLLHLGTGNDIVLYRPGHGPVRVPAGDVVLLPAEPSKCRPSL